MSRYASARDGERLVFPGNFTGWFGVQVIDPRLLAAAVDPEALRRHAEQKARQVAIDGYNTARDGSLETQSWQWMKPRGRPRFRWVTRDWGALPLLEVTCVVYPEGALP